MNYTINDLAWYGGLILGTAGTFKALELIGVASYWGRLIPAAIVGLGLGWLAQKLLMASAKKEK